jgi:hypothetical protein
MSDKLLMGVALIIFGILMWVSGRGAYPERTNIIYMGYGAMTIGFAFTIWGTAEMILTTWG